MSLKDLESYRNRLIASSGSDLQLNREFLRYVREHYIRESTLVVKYGSGFVDKHSSYLGDELWNVLEQICIAALDVHDVNLATVCIQKLDAKFPDSSRVRRLHALRMEAAGRSDDADIVYQRMLLDDNTNVFAMKRRITVAKERRDISRAILLLNEYLKVYMADTEAWLELADLYLSQQMYSNAAFCFEELILSNPQNYHLYVKYAELRYTMGGIENLELAKKYYSFALELQSESNNNRAWFGLATTTHAIACLAAASKKVSSSEATKLLPELNQLAREQLQKSYQEAGVSSEITEYLAQTLADLTVEPRAESSTAASSTSSTSEPEPAKKTGKK